MKKHAYFAGGCFWCITPIFKIYGASQVISGYSGGSEVNPTYEAVKHQETGHRETIAITYDSTKVTYEKLLAIFLANVDPFDGGGQFIDRGHSYTLAIYYQTKKEKAAAEKAIRELEKTSGKKAQIAIEAFTAFYPAEEYHQDYYLKNPKEFEEELISSGRKKVDSAKADSVTSHYCYMVRCADGSLYTGYTTDPKRREAEHNSKSKGAKYTRSRQPVELVYTEAFDTKEEAMAREYYIKHHLSKLQKEELIGTEGQPLGQKSRP